MEENTKEQRLKWIEQGQEFMKGGGSLTDFKARMRSQAASDNSVAFVSERLLNVEFERRLNRGLMGGLFGQLMALLLIIGGCVMAYWLWTYSDSYFIISTIPFFLIMAGVIMLGNK